MCNIPEKLYSYIKSIIYCKYADKFDKEQWNYAFWRKDEVMIIDPNIKNVEKNLYVFYILELCI